MDTLVGVAILAAIVFAAIYRLALFVRTCLEIYLRWPPKSRR